MAECLELALALANTLGVVHDKGVVHGDLNPRNILYRRRDQLVVLIDFSCATQQGPDSVYLPFEHGPLGTPAYMSPEQTGRMNRSPTCAGCAPSSSTEYG